MVLDEIRLELLERGPLRFGTQGDQSPKVFDKKSFLRISGIQERWLTDYDGILHEPGHGVESRSQGARLHKPRHRFLLHLLESRGHGDRGLEVRVHDEAKGKCYPNQHKAELLPEGNVGHRFNR